MAAFSNNYNYVWHSSKLKCFFKVEKYFYFKTHQTGCCDANSGEVLRRFETWG
jgi:hypothetical protein